MATIHQDLRYLNKTAGQNLQLSSVMATTFAFSSKVPHLNCRQKSLNFQSNNPNGFCIFRCSENNPPNSNSSSTGSRGPEFENALLKLAWYGSEFLGIATSLFRSPQRVEAPQGSLEVHKDSFGAVDRATLVQTIKEDFERSYFVTGNLTLDAYEENCEFADPASSFIGLQRFKRNCTNFGSLLVKSNMKLTKWEDFEDKGIGHWKFSCILSFPWRPILSASGYTEYFFDASSGKVTRHVEHWNVPKMALLKQICRPSRRFWLN